MKLYISLDMEGIPGTYDWRQETDNKDRVRSYIYKQMEWVLEGIKKSSRNSEITEIAIADSHSLGNNLLYDFTELDNRIMLISGYPRPQYMMPALDASYDMVFFIGYHGGIGTMCAAMDHTYSSRRVHNIWINGQRMNESLINAAYAGYYNIPVALVTGDTALKKELMQKDAMPWVKYVETKEAISKFASKLYPLGKIKEDTIKTVSETLDAPKDSFKPFKFSSPVTLKMEFASTGMTDVASLLPYSKRLDGRTVEFTCDDYKIMFDAIMAFVTLASAVNA